MKIYTYIIIVVAAISLASCGKDNHHSSSSGISVRDDLGNVMKFDSPPKRVVSLAPNLTEMVFALGNGKFIVGNTVYCNKPDSAKKITKVGDLLSIDCEKIVSLKPDLVLLTVEGNPKTTSERLKALGLKVFISNPRTYEGIKKTYTDLGEIFSSGKKAKSDIQGWDSGIAVLKKQFEHFNNKNVLFLVSVNPIMAAGKNTFLNELIKVTGMNNLAGAEPFNYPVLSRENVVKMDPDYILIAGMDKQFGDISGLYPEWSKIKAVKSKHIIYLNPDLYMRPGPHFIEALSDLFTNLRRQEGSHYQD